MNPADFKPMLAKDPKYDEQGNPVIPFPVLLQPKLDGIRASVVGGKLRSRTLKPIPNAEIRAALERPEFEGLDGELIVGLPTAENCYNRSVSFVMSESKTGEPWSFMVFDKWDHPGTTQDRFNAAKLVVEQVAWDSVPVAMVAMQQADNMAELVAMEELMVTQGFEGMIGRAPNAAYKFGRSGKTGPLWKIKRFVDFEARVIGVFEEQHNANEAKRNALGRTERSSHKDGKIGKGTLGGLILVAINGDFEGVEFRCGTGFSAADRIALWTQAQYGFAPDGEGLNGRVAKVKFFPVGSKDKPRHPVFLGWRDMELDG